MMDIFNKLDVLCNKQVKNSKVLEKWVVDMWKKLGALKLRQIHNLISLFLFVFLGVC
jgi:hypothetical protein